MFSVVEQKFTINSMAQAGYTGMYIKPAWMRETLRDKPISLKCSGFRRTEETVIRQWLAVLKWTCVKIDGKPAASHVHRDCLIILEAVIYVSKWW